VYEFKIGHVSRSTPGVTEASCAILSVRIEFCKSRREQQRSHAEVDSAAPPTARQSGDSGGERRRRVTMDRTPAKTRSERRTPATQPTSPSRAISVAGRGKMVVIDDGVYDQFARRHPPKYVTSSRMFDAMFSRRVVSK